MANYFIGDNFKITKNDNSPVFKTNAIILILLVLQLLFAYLGKTSSFIFYYLELLPILVLFYILFKKIKNNTIDILIILFIIIFLYQFISNVLSLF